jgi:hypothetical protein
MTGDGEDVAGSVLLILALLLALKRECGCGRLEALMGLELLKVTAWVVSAVVMTDSCKRGRLSRVSSCSFSLSCSCTRLLGPTPLLLIDGTAPSNIRTSFSDKTKKKIDPTCQSP